MCREINREPEPLGNAGCHKHTNGSDLENSEALPDLHKERSATRVASASSRTKINEPVDAAHQRSSADNVAEGYWDETVENDDHVSPQQSAMVAPT
jgi:hypothetical protein